MFLVYNVGDSTVSYQTSFLAPWVSMRDLLSDVPSGGDEEGGITVWYDTLESHSDKKCSCLSCGIVECLDFRIGKSAVVDADFVDNSIVIGSI